MPGDGARERLQGRDPAVRVGDAQAELPGRAGAALLRPRGVPEPRGGGARGRALAVRRRQDRARLHQLLAGRAQDRRGRCQLRACAVPAQAQGQALQSGRFREGGLSQG